VRLADEILGQWAPVVDAVELKSGSKGRFEVQIDGEDVFSKARSERFPAEGEIVKLLRPKLGPPPEWRSTHEGGR
jgi:selT/selW/selH-like putative selenoprotein